MFTGLIEEIGKIKEIRTNLVIVECSFAKELKIGNSVAVNGTCLTVVKASQKEFYANISPETYRVTTWGNKLPGQTVNLERAMNAKSRLDGHLVYGHVDCVAPILNVEKNAEFWNISIKLEAPFRNLVVPKGSIAVDGISLTIATTREDYFSITLIPETLANTTLQNITTGDFVNIEYDMFAKYIEKNLSVYHNKSKISLEFLEENGFLS